MVKKNIIKFIPRNMLKIAYSLKLNKKLFLKNRIFFNKSTILFNFMKDCKVFVYKGLNFRKLHIINFIIAFKLGNFCFTRKLFTYRSKKKSKKNFYKR